MEAIILVSYFGLLAFLCVQSAHRVILGIFALRAQAALAPQPESWPTVLLQLPLYNEPAVVRRLIEAVLRLDYPKDKLRIQILDDSTDQTSLLIAQKLKSVEGVRVEHCRRNSRANYKAGAIMHGLKGAKESLVAMFDADFLPTPDFLKKAVAALWQDEKAAFVQLPWGHVNREDNWLTRAQAVFLDAHFHVEHRGRHQAGCFFNFNGTAGVWRREAIEALGGFCATTVTEDMELSMRAHLAGWRFIYLHGPAQPAELPGELPAFAGQQARWVKGGMQVMRGYLPKVLRSSTSSRFAKLDALMFLTANLNHMGLVALVFLLPTTLWLRDTLLYRVPFGQSVLTVFDFTLLGAGFWLLVSFYGTGQFLSSKRVRFWDVLVAMMLGLGMSFRNARAAWDGFWSAGGEFVRTPKKGFGQGALTAPSLSAGWLEFLVGLLYAAASVYAFLLGRYFAIPFLLLFCGGFWLVSALSWKGRWRRPEVVTT